jgi:hypothetical protein
VYCPNCGAQNSDNASYCANCGNALQRINTPNVDVPSPSPPPGSSLGAELPGSSDSCDFVLLPAFRHRFDSVRAAQVNGKLAAGDRAGALQSSQNAKTWAWLSFGFGIAFWFFLVFLQLL